LPLAKLRRFQRTKLAAATKRLLSTPYLNRQKSAKTLGTQFA
jgi:hypothetical protein